MAPRHDFYSDLSTFRRCIYQKVLCTKSQKTVKTTITEFGILENGKLATLIYVTGTIADDTGSLKFLHTLFDLSIHYLINMLTHANRMVQAMPNFVLFDKKWLAIFDKKLTSFWKMFL